MPQTTARTNHRNLADPTSNPTYTEGSDYMLTWTVDVNTANWDTDWESYYQSRRNPFTCVFFRDYDFIANADARHTTGSRNLQKRDLAFVSDIPIEEWIQAYATPIDLTYNYRAPTFKADAAANTAFGELGKFLTSRRIAYIVCNRDYWHQHKDQPSQYHSFIILPRL